MHRSMKRTADNVISIFSLQHMLAAVLMRAAAMCSCRFRRWLSVIAILLFVVSPVTAFADCGPVTQGDSGSRPRVGLALSGGGARGAAHIGVMRVLLEEGVAIDCIAGTSMGAIIGGLFASGMTLDEIEQALNDIDWQGKTMSVRINGLDTQYMYRDVVDIVGSLGLQRCRAQP